ncbi:MAG TPA: biopolymer transporter ExbD [Polyangiaceae bacterium]|nr:biopolymer transporter ExbD [Polyangiaceae bacterium]
MANIDLRARSKRRLTNHDLPLVPFIDFLLCLVSFLLVTAAFSDFARLSGAANVPGRLVSEVPELHPKQLHVEMQERTFRITWRDGNTVLESAEVPLAPVESAHGRRYPALSEFLERDFRANGTHRDASDPALDLAVLHVRNSAEYEDVVAALDAIHAPQRAYLGTKQTSAFAVTLAAD